MLWIWKSAKGMTVKGQLIPYLSWRGKGKSNWAHEFWTELVWRRIGEDCYTSWISDILCSHHLDNVLISILVTVSKNFYSVYKMPHAKVLGASEGRSVHPSVTTPPLYLSISQFAHPSIHSHIRLSTHPPTYLPTFLTSLWSSNFHPTVFSFPLHACNNLSTGLLASSPSHFASSVHKAAWLIFLHVSFPICKIKVLFISLDCCEWDRPLFIHQRFVELVLHVSVSTVGTRDKTSRSLPLWSSHSSGKERQWLPNSINTWCSFRERQMPRSEVVTHSKCK